MANSNPSKKQGISATEAKGLTVKGVPMNPEQLANSNTILDQAIADGAPPRATKAMVLAAIGESGIMVVKNPRSVYSGVFQADPRNVPADATATQAHYFLIGGFGFQGGGAIKLAKDNPGWTGGHIAFTVEGDLSNFHGDEAKAARFYDVCPDGASYNASDEADAIIEAYGGIGDFTESNSSANVATSYLFTRGTVDDQQENSWDAGQRLAGEVDGWDLFAVANRFYYFSEERLIRQIPIAVISRTDPTVISLSGTVDNTSNATECRVTLLCGLFDFHAGEVLKITNAGPFSTGKYKGRWIITDTSGSRYKPTVDLTLALPKPKGIEPAHDTKPGSTTASNKSTSGSGLYVNPFKGAKVVPNRIDQGVDYVITGPIGAIGDAKIVANLTYQGFGTYLVYQLTNGEFATNYIYVSEGIRVTTKVGQTVKAGDKICEGVGAIEIGWAQKGPTYLPMAKITGGYVEGQKTAAGANFNDLMVSLGVPSGTTSGRPTVGHYP